MRIKNLAMKIVVLIFIITTVSCGGGKDSESSDEAFEVSPHIDIQSLQEDGCLNLTKLVARMSQDQFQYPARKVTQDFKMSKLNRRAFIYNFGIEDFTWHGFPLLSQLTQSKCSEVSVENSYGRKLSYDIQASGRDFVYLIRNRNKDARESSSRAVQNARLEEPEILQLKIKLLSPNSLTIHQVSRTIMPICGDQKPVNLEKTTLYRWGTSDREWPSSEAVSFETMQAALKILDQSSEALLESSHESSEFQVHQISEIQSQLRQTDTGLKCGS